MGCGPYNFARYITFARIQMRIELLTNATRPQVVPMMALLQEHERSLSDDREPGERIADGHLRYLEDTCATCNGAIFVALEHDTALGFIVCFTESIENADLHIRTPHRTYGSISDLYVHSAARGKGVATALVHAAEEHLRAVGARNIQIMALRGNVGALQLYELLGYAPYEIIMRKEL